jgi:hypothetical protein
MPDLACPPSLYILRTAGGFIVVPGCTLEERQRVSPTRTVVATNAAHPEEPDHRYTHLCERWQGSISDAEDLRGALMTENLEWNLAELADGPPTFQISAVRAMTSDQNAKLDAPWGLGWALRGSRVWNAFGDLLPATAFGHAGATGTLAWADPGSKLSCVILTNRPYAIDNGRMLRLMSDIVASSVEPVA